MFLVDSSAFVDPIDEIRNLAMKLKQTVRLVSAMDKKRLNRAIENKTDSWLIITDINLFDDDLLLIRVNSSASSSSIHFFLFQDFLLSAFDNKIWLLCNPSHENKVPRKSSNRNLEKKFINRFID